jgi:Prp8 binding protein
MMANICSPAALTTSSGMATSLHFLLITRLLLTIHFSSLKLNIHRRYDTRMPDAEADLVLAGHQDTITGLSISPDGNHLLSNSMDCFLRVWDVRPFAVNTATRCERVMPGVHHGAEKLLLKCAWSPDQEFITAGSADRLVHLRSRLIWVVFISLFLRIVHLWESNGYKEVCGWPGHKASVNEVIIHPTEPIIASCSSDRSIILGEFSI